MASALPRLANSVKLPRALTRAGGGLIRKLDEDARRLMSLFVLTRGLANGVGKQAALPLVAREAKHINRSSSARTSSSTRSGKARYRNAR